MLGSVKAELEEARAFVEDNEVYLSLKYKNVKTEDGRIVRVWYPKIRLPISTNALPEVEVEITEERAMEILKKEYGCPVKIIKKGADSYED